MKNTYNVQYVVKDTDLFTSGTNVVAESYSDALQILSELYKIEENQIIYIVCKNHSYNS